MPQPTDPSSAEISALLIEERTFAPPAAFTAAAHASDPAVYARAAADPEAFWAGFARELEWITPFTKVLEWQSPDAKWFVRRPAERRRPTASTATCARRAATRPRSSGKASPATAAR